MTIKIGGAYAARPLHFIWLCDCSGSMSVDGKIQALNNAIREVIPHMQREATQNPNAQVLVRAIRFASDVKWHVSTPTPVHEFVWQDLSASGETAMGAALETVAEELGKTLSGTRALRPVLVLISDGQPTDDFKGSLKKLLDEPWAEKAVRVAIAIGRDADYETLQKFIGRTGWKPLQANNPEALLKCVVWASTAVLRSVSAMRRDPGSDDNDVPPPPPDEFEEEISAQPSVGWYKTW